jgi:hypothetical protein
MDHDGFWKEALDRYLEPFLRLCFPRVHDGIDWSRAHVPLDQGLRQFLGNTQTRKRQVDRLYRVTTHDGTEEHLFLHVAIVILAQRAAQQRVQSPGERKTLKWNLTRRLYERGYDRPHSPRPPSGRTKREPPVPRRPPSGSSTVPTTRATGQEVRTFVPWVEWCRDKRIAAAQAPALKRTMDLQGAWAWRGWSKGSNTFCPLRRCGARPARRAWFPPACSKHHSYPRNNQASFHTRRLLKQPSYDERSGSKLRAWRRPDPFGGGHTRFGRTAT